MSHLKYGLLGFILIASLPLYATTILHVSLSTDDDAGGYGQNGDLRHAMNTMNEQLNQGSLDDYQIVFDMPMTISLNGILPIINNSTAPVNITIGNSGTTQTVIIDGQGQFNGFFTPMGNVTIQNMIFQNLLAKGGDGGDGISGGGGGMGAGPALYIPQTFLNGSNPQITLKNVLIKECSAIGGNGGHYNISSPTGNEGGGGGGGFAGHGGSIKTNGTTGGGGGGGFGGHGGDVHISSEVDPLSGGGGGGGGGLGSLSTILSSSNLGLGGNDNTPGTDGNGYGLNFSGGSGAGGFSGGNHAGGGGGGGAISASDQSGGGGGGSYGNNGLIPTGNMPAIILRSDITPSGGKGNDGGGGGGGGVVNYNFVSNAIDGQAGNGGYGGGGGGGAGTGAYDFNYTVQGGIGGIGGGGGGGGVNTSGNTSAQGGDSQAGGGGGGGGPSDGISAAGGIDTGGLGGGAGGLGNNSVGINYGGGGGGGGSAHGGAIFVDSAVNLIIETFSGTGGPTSFDTQNNTVFGGSGGVGAGDDSHNGQSGSATGDSIFLRSASALTLKANAVNDILTLGSGVNFISDSSDATIFINGSGTVIYNGTSDGYPGKVKIDQANFEVNGTIAGNDFEICRDDPSSTQRGTLSGQGLVNAYVLANSGSISPDANQTLTLKNLTLNSASSDSLGSLVHSEINANGASLVRVNQTATLAGTLEINVDTNAVPGRYTLLSANSIIGQFENIQFIGSTPNYTLSYLPQGNPQYIQFELLSNPTSVDIPATVNGHPIVNSTVVCCGRPVLLGPLPIAGSGSTVYTIQSQTGHVKCQIRTTGSQTFLKMYGTNGSCTIVGTKNGIQSNPLTIVAPTT